MGLKYWGGHCLPLWGASLLRIPWSSAHILMLSSDPDLQNPRYQRKYMVFLLSNNYI